VVQETWLGVLSASQDGRRCGRGASASRRTSPAPGPRASGAGGRSRQWPAAPAIPPKPAVDPERFLSADDPARPGQWACGPGARATPEERLLSRETRELTRAAIEALPAPQRLVVTLRDVEGWAAEEACDALDLTARTSACCCIARAKVRAALEDHLCTA